MAAQSQFSADLNAWIAQRDERILAVFRESTKRVVNNMQDRIPKDTGFAWNSIRASLDEMPIVDPGARGVRRPKGMTGLLYSYDGAEVVLTIANARISDTIYVGYTASYVQYLEWGHSGRAPQGFVGVSALEWPQIVEQVSQEYKARAMGDMG